MGFPWIRVIALTGVSLGTRKALGVAATLALGVAACGTSGLAVGTSEDALGAPPPSPIADKLETVPTGEAAEIDEIARRFTEASRAAYDAEVAKVGSSAVAYRGAHGKHHGCVKASLTVEAALPAEARGVGVFKEGARYDAWVRFSNGASAPQSDLIPDGRGMAIKLVGVPGEKLLEGDERFAPTQDFIMINHPRMFLRDLQGYLDLMKANGTPDPTKFLMPNANPVSWRLYEINILRQVAMQVVNSPLAPQYFSETPYLLGDRAIKFSARPCAPRPSPPNAWSLSGNRLREAMAAELAQGDACFDFLVQMQGDPSRMPVEDSTVEWSESESPFVKVARLEIPAQVFDTPARHQTCENLSFNPWHALPEHRPLGNLNRARRAVYDASSKLRHTLNVAPRQEPVDLKVPGE